MLEGEQKLVERAKEGESSAFGLLYDYYLPKIYRFVLIKVSQREEAEDITHLTFLKAWESIDRYSYHGYSFGSWLYQIARNVVIDHYRGTSVQTSLEDADEPESNEPWPGHDLDTKVKYAEVMQALSKLGTLEQDVIIMRFVENLPVRDVAEAIGKSEGAVKLIQHRAMKKLKGYLK
jgi:RNA polymerase sigma factor (sigma-70 family)